MAADPLTETLALGALAGVTIPLGGMMAQASLRAGRVPNAEVLHGTVAFGGGALLSAVALVLVPEGIERLSPPFALAFFGLGGLVFALADRALKKRSGTGAQLIAMLTDFLPEAMALGALLATDGNRSVLLALMIALQNLPEAFNAFREISLARVMTPVHLLVVFAGLLLLGPLAAGVGHLALAGYPPVLGAIMLTASGGILYILFEDIAPQVPLERHWLPPMGAVAGFMLGLAGFLYLG